MRIGVFGGTFDPVHYGHLLLAESCREQCRLDRVWFLPTAVPPHKQDAVITPAEARVEMLSLAISGNEAFEISRHEIERGGVNYTVDTLKHFREARPDDELFFLMGADSLADLPTWREPGRVCELANIVLVRRPGMPELKFDALKPLVSAERIAAMRQNVVEMPLIELAAHELRERVAAGKSIRFRAPRAVEKYIETHSLYRT